MILIALALYLLGLALMVLDLSQPPDPLRFADDLVLNLAGCLFWPFVVALFLAALTAKALRRAVKRRARRPMR